MIETVLGKKLPIIFGKGTWEFARKKMAGGKSIHFLSGFFHCHVRHMIADRKSRISLDCVDTSLFTLPTCSGMLCSHTAYTGLFDERKSHQVMGRTISSARNDDVHLNWIQVGWSYASEDAHFMAVDFWRVKGCVKFRDG